MLRSTSEILEEFPVKKINGLLYYREDHVRVAMVKCKNEGIDDFIRYNTTKKMIRPKSYELSISEFAKKAVSESFGIPISDLESRNRMIEIVNPKYALRILMLNKGLSRSSICRILKLNRSTLINTIDSHNILMSDKGYGNKTYQKQFKIAQEKFLNYVS